MPEVGQKVWYYPEKADVPDQGRPGQFLNDTEELYANGKPLDAIVVTVYYGDMVDLELENPTDKRGPKYFRRRVPFIDKGEQHPSSRYAAPVGGA